ncbi:hypothetical protein KIN20_014474 [Parelaphostrongylus tenuis]|uniref:Uncharacterized protein n=1 Tax=Parelaphostrongylus tenuis TaxID=148309 RepID=A0AAD5MDR9_PARTN|nr:hypothetical protein KIN20_014474 [Parelaphostrongylus tenuis]
MAVSKGTTCVFATDNVNKAVEEACQCLNLSDEKLRKVMEALHISMEQGLKKGTRK